MRRNLSRKRLDLDVCILSRPFDDQAALRIHMETDAFYLILNGVMKAHYGLIVSPVHIAEIQAIADSRERLELISLLEQLGTRVSVDSIGVRHRAEALHSRGFGVADAAHVAFAEASSACFISCDDRLLKKCKRKGVSIPAMNPVEFCLQEDLR